MTIFSLKLQYFLFPRINYLLYYQVAYLSYDFPAFPSIINMCVCVFVYMCVYN